MEFLETEDTTSEEETLDEDLETTQPAESFEMEQISTDPLHEEENIENTYQPIDFTTYRVPPSNNLHLVDDNQIYTDTESEISDYDDEEEDLTDLDESVIQDFVAMDTSQCLHLHLLAEFCLTNLSDSSTNKLLHILRQMKVNVPSSHKELYGVPVNKMPTPIAIAGGYFMYIGIEANLKFFEFENFDEELICEFSWDGVRLNKSSAIKMEPLVMSFKNYPKAGVLLVGIHFGNEPQNPNEYFYSLINELNHIFENNRTVHVGKNGKTLRLSVSSFIGDTPARTFARGEYFER